MSTLPEFLVIGAQKAGTSWLHQNLRQHPGIFMPEAKDQGYFCWVEGPQAISPEDYQRNFDGGRGGQLAGEATAAYFWTSTGSPWDVKPAGYCPDIPGRVKHALGEEVRFLLSLRDPVERAVSAYLHHIAFGDLDPAVGLLDAGGFAGLLDIGFYAAHLRNWLRYFPRENFLVLDFEHDVVAQPHRTLQSVFEFLGVDAGWQQGDAAQPVFEGPERVWVEDEVWVPAGDYPDGLSDEIRQINARPYRRLVDRSTIDTLREIYAADQAGLPGLLS
jgi:hypothetical protein